jgi:CarD family transcriptional regulator
MDFKVGQKVSYPNHGVCAVEGIEEKQLSGSRVEFYQLRVCSNNSAIYVPKSNAKTIGVRPIINSLQCSELLKTLASDFTTGSGDWKIRVRDYSAKIQTGDIFEVSEVLKQLTLLSFAKQLSFREQRLLEKAKFLVVSELAEVCSQAECEVEKTVDRLLSEACGKNLSENENAVLAAVR